MAIRTEERAEIREYLATAEAITWDTCHKIYILMDDTQVKQMKEYGYEPIVTKDVVSPKQMSAIITRWYENSCGLRFVQVISTGENGEPEFESPVPQRF